MVYHAISRGTSPFLVRESQVLFLEFSITYVLKIGLRWEIDVPTVQLIREAKIRIYFQTARSSSKMRIFLEDLAESP